MGHDLSNVYINDLKPAFSMDYAELHFNGYVCFRLDNARYHPGVHVQSGGDEQGDGAAQPQHARGPEHCLCSGIPSEPAQSRLPPPQQVSHTTLRVVVCTAISIFLFSCLLF